jgi:putative hydrolase of the HAD superfamily
MKNSDAIFERHIRPLEPLPTGVRPVLGKIQPFSAILFDVYGTLLISGAGEIGTDREPAAIDEDKTMVHLLRRYGIEYTPVQIQQAFHEAVEQTHANSRKQGVDTPEVDIVRLWQRVLGSTALPWIDEFAMEYELTVNPVYPMPGMNALLATCKAGSTPMGIVSNAQFYTVLLLEHFLGAPLTACGFKRRLLFFSWLEQYAKPSSVMFARARTVLEEMGIPTASVVYVGNDMRNDILPAASVGFKTALFAGDQRSLRQRETDDRCREVKPDLIITDLRQLLACIGNA